MNDPSGRRSANRPAGENACFGRSPISRRLPRRVIHGPFKWVSLNYTAALLLACTLAVPCAASGNSDGVILQLPAGQDINTFAGNVGATVEDSVPGQNVYLLRSSSADDRLTQELNGEGSGLVAEKNGETNSAEVVGDPFHFAGEVNAFAGTFATSATYAQVNLGQTLFTTQGFGVVVAVLDTGVTASHPVLQSNIMAGLNTMQTAAAPADISDGVTNADAGHGTFIAGLIAHLAPHSAIMPIRVMNADGKGSVFATVQGIYYAIAHGARIITLSLTPTEHSGALQTALDAADAAGVILVTAAGNDGSNQSQLPISGHGALTVASVESDNTKSPYSNYGSFVRVVAPGSGVRSTYWNNNYATWSGTSFAVPMVAAEAALVLAANPSLTSGDVVSIIRNTAHSVDKQNPAFKGLLGKGVIDIAAAVSKAANSGTIPASATLSGVISLDGIADNASPQSIIFTFRPTDGSAPFNRTVAAGANTAYSFTDIPPANYTVHVAAARYLAVNVPLNLTFASISGLTIILPAGDANGDNFVDIADFGLLVNAYGSDISIAGSGYDARVDFNSDRIVDIADFGLLVNSYGLQGDL